MKKNLEIKIEGKSKGRLELEETETDEIKVIHVELPQEIREKLSMGIMNEGSICGLNYIQYKEMIQHGMEHYLNKKVELIEFTSPSYSQKI